MSEAIQVEQEFDLFFKQIEFNRVSTIVGTSPTFRNADYLNEKMRVVVELKVLDKDHFQNGGIIDRFFGFVAIPILGQVDKDGAGLYNTSWPPLNREGKNDAFEEPLRKILKNANRQLKETKAHLFSGEGTGLLMLALNKFRSLSPKAVLTLVSALLQEEFSAIDACIVCTPSWGLNQSSPFPLLHQPACLLGVPEDTRPLMRAVFQRITHKWSDFYNAGGHVWF